MTIELQPEIERQRMERDGFTSVEEVLTSIVKSTSAEHSVKSTKPNFGQFLLDSPIHNSGLILERVAEQPRPVEL